jgi:deoxyribonuclease V
LNRNGKKSRILGKAENLMGEADVAINFSTSKARQAQKCMAQKIILEDRLPEKIKRIAGVDATYKGDFIIGAVVVLDFDSLELLETQTVMQLAKFPYIPTFLAFREVPAAVACVKRLKIQPDVFLVDGHGLAHSYRCGFASHLGLALRRPTVGVAKNKLVGEHVEIGENSYLVQSGEVIAAVVSHHSGSKPVYVSVGHLLSLETAVKIVKHCTRGGRIPEPIRQAHLAAAEIKKNTIVTPCN